MQEPSSRRRHRPLTLCGDCPYLLYVVGYQDLMQTPLPRPHTYLQVVQQLHHTGEEGMPGLPKRDQHDVSSRPAHKANLEHTAKNSPGSDPR